MNIGVAIALIKKFAPGIDPSTIEQAVSDWLDAHPEATTTVQDGSITEAKLAADVLANLAEIDTLSEAIEKINIPVEYKFSGTDLLLGFGFSSTLDYVIVMNNGRKNGLFDFAKLCTKAKGTSLEDLDTADLTTVWSSSTDMHSPFRFLANQNADGYHADAVTDGFVGGNHTLDSMGTGFETASSVYVHFFADGSPVSSGYGKCSSFEIRWANDVQAYNTVKQGGGGRACLREYHDMIFDGVVFNEKITLEALEAITITTYLGLQCVSVGNTYKKIAFVDATNRGVFNSTDSNIQSGNKVTSGVILWGDDHRVEINVDTNIDLGKRDFYLQAGEQGAFISNGKSYFYIIGKTTVMGQGTRYYLNGSYRFMPSISTGGDVPCTGITLNKNSCSFESVGDTDTLTATLTPANTTDSLSWASSNENVATVNNGVVTIHGIGTATITATCGEQTATASVNVTTLKAPYELKVVSGKIISKQAVDNSDGILYCNTNSGQKSVGQPYTGEVSLAVVNGETNDIECIAVPYGATKAKIHTSDGVAVSISYAYRANRNSLITFPTDGNQYPEYIDRSSFVNTNTGLTCEYGQAIVFRPTDEQSPTLEYVYFE